MAGNVDYKQGNESALCNECLMEIPYSLEFVSGSVFLRKLCPVHGTQNVLISKDADYYRKATDLEAALHSLTSSEAEPESLTSKKPYMLMLEVVDECNVGCPTCIAASKFGDGNFRQPTEIIERVSRLKEITGQLDLIMVTGGEPTLHPDLIDILMKLTMHANQVMLITHGGKIAEDLEFVKRLVDVGNGFEIYLQFDSMRESVLTELRGKDFRKIRQKAIENLSFYNIPTTLVCVIKKGLNDDELADIVKFAVKQKNVRGVTFQPIRSSGRHSKFNYDDHSITLSEVRQNLIDNLQLSSNALIPHPLNPKNICIGYFSRNNFPTIEKSAEVFSLTDVNYRMTSKMLYLPQKICSEVFNEPNLFRMTIISFLDKYNLTTPDSREGGIKFLTDDGQLVPLDKKFIYEANKPTKGGIKMSNDTEYGIVLTTTGNEEQAEGLAKKILDSKLAACIQVQNIKSFYTWKGEQCCDPECLLLIKTRTNLYDELQSLILKNHAYETPEIIKIPITNGYSGYLNWINEVTNA